MSGLIKTILTGDKKLSGAFGALQSKVQAAKQSGKWSGTGGLGGLMSELQAYKKGQSGGGGAVMPKQKPIAPRVDPRGVLPMNTMGNDSIANLANARIRRK